MRVRIERRGGLAGRPAVGERDENQLSAAERDALEALLKSPPAAPSPGADRFSYRVRVEDEHGIRELQVPEDAMPAILADIPKIGF
jgi:hypothetical protein